MAISFKGSMVIGPRFGIVQEGLVLNLDAGNTASYPGSGTTWFDLTSNNNDGVLTNGPTFDSANGGSIVFDGADDYVSLGTIPEIAPGTGDFTIEIWINPTNWSNTYMPIFTTTLTNGLWIGKNSSNFVLRAYSVADDLQYSTFPSVGEWTKITIRRSGTDANMYYNNVSVANGTVSRNYVQGNSEISRDGGTNEFWGKISSFKYYNRALTDSEMFQNYNTLKNRFGL